MRHLLLKYQLRRLPLLLRPLLRLSFKHQRLKCQLLSPRLLLRQLFTHQRLKHQLLSRLPLHRSLLKHRLLPPVRWSQVEPLRANQRVMRHVKFLAPLLRAPTHHVLLPLVVHPVSQLLAVRQVRRLVVQSAQLVVQFRLRLDVP